MHTTHALFIHEARWRFDQTDLWSPAPVCHENHLVLKLSGHGTLRRINPNWSHETNSNKESCGLTCTSHEPIQLNKDKSFFCWAAPRTHSKPRALTEQLGLVCTSPDWAAGDGWSVAQSKSSGPWCGDKGCSCSPHRFFMWPEAGLISEVCCSESHSENWMKKDDKNVYSCYLWVKLCPSCWSHQQQTLKYTIVLKEASFLIISRCSGMFLLLFLIIIIIFICEAWTE